MRDFDAAQPGPHRASRTRKAPGPSSHGRLPGQGAPRSSPRGSAGDLRRCEPQAPTTVPGATAAASPSTRAPCGRRQPDTSWLGGLAGLTDLAAPGPASPLLRTARAVPNPGSRAPSASSSRLRPGQRTPGRRPARTRIPCRHRQSVQDPPPYKTPTPRPGRFMLYGEYSLSHRFPGGQMAKVDSMRGIVSIATIIQ